jgi:hypothetical protein
MLRGMTTDAPATGQRQRRGIPWALAFLAFLAMVPVGFFYAASGLVVPGPWLYLLWLLFAVLLGVGVWLARRRSWWLLLVPVGGAVAWWAVVSAGEAWLGWTG